MHAQVPSDLDFENKANQGRPSETPTSERNANPRSSFKKPSKLMIVTGLLLIGGIVCLARGHSSLGAKLGVACILQKLSGEGNTNSPGTPKVGAHDWNFSFVEDNLSKRFVETCTHNNTDCSKWFSLWICDDACGDLSLEDLIDFNIFGVSCALLLHYYLAKSRAILGMGWLNHRFIANRDANIMLIKLFFFQVHQAICSKAFASFV